MTDLWRTLQDECRRAIRTLLRNSGFTFWTIVLMASTIGAVTSLGSAAYELLRGRLPFGHADKLVMIWSDLTRSGYARAPLSGPEIYDLRERTRSFSGVAAIATTTVTAGMLKDPLQIGVGRVTGNFFSVLEATPLYGRTFTAEDEGAGKTPTVILSWGLWQSKFGGDRSIVGTMIPLNGVSTEVIGVMPESFRMTFAPDSNIPENTQAWTPIDDTLRNSPRNRYFLRVVARLRDGVSEANASSDVASLAASLLHEWSGYGGSGRRMFAVRLEDDLAKPVQVAAFSLLFAGIFLVLLGFVNVSGILIARTAEQRKEFAICQAIGASLTRARNQALLQVGILSTVGCVLGLIAGKLGLLALRQLRPPSLARIDHSLLSWQVLLLVVGIVFVSTLFLVLITAAGIAPLKTADLVGTRVDSAPRYRLRAGLIVVQVGLAMLFLVCSALCMRTFINVMQTDLGFRPEQALTVRYSLNPLAIRDLGEMSLMHKRLNDAISATPGVIAAGSISHLPFDGLPLASMTYRSAEAPEGNEREADVRTVSPGMLSAVGGRIRSGRFFEEGDSFDAPKTIVVDRSLAERTWPGESPVGKKMLVATWAGVPPTTFTVIGVIEHMRYKAIEMEVREQIYISLRQFPYGPWAWIIRSSVDPNSLVSAINQRVHEVDSRIPVWDARLLSTYYGDAAAGRRFTAVLLSVFAVAALALAAIGIYGLLTYIVTARRNEFGIRIALGAQTNSLVVSVLRESLIWAVISSVVTGLLFFPMVTRVSRSLLYGVSPYDPFSWLSAASILIVVVVIASCVPAFRAGRVSPANLMRYL